MSKTLKTIITIDLEHCHCLYCGKTLLPSQGYGDFTVTPPEIACSENHLNKYRGNKQVLKKGK